jgi:peroxiredoxin
VSGIRTFDEDFAKICAMEGTLRARLDALGKIIAVHDPEFSSAYDELVTQLRAVGAGEGAPKCGDVMPNFLMPDYQGNLVSLESLLAAGPVVISFNRGHWCEYCDLELRAFAAAHGEFQRHGARVICIMPERLEYLRKVSERNGHACLVLCDMDNSYAMQLNLVMWLGVHIKKLLAGSGFSLDVIQGNNSGFVPIPATFVLDKSGVVIARFVDPDFRKRMEIADVLSAIASIKPA